MHDKKKILKTLTILYAEDDESTRKNITQTLELFVHRVIPVENGAKAIEAFQKNVIHIAILDYVMPIIDGNETATFIREHDQTIPIIMLSSYLDKKYLLNALRTGVNDYLEKPISFDSLLSMLLECVQKIINSGKLLTRISEHIHYDYIEKSLHMPDHCERLTKNEYLFLEILLERPMSLIQKEEIEHRVFEGAVEPNALRNMIYRLRKKIPDNIIVTIKDIGYMINLP